MESMGQLAAGAFGNSLFTERAETSKARLLRACQGLILRSREAASRRMDATKGLAAILRDARKSALLQR
jgi:hypothetical protein